MRVNVNNIGVIGQGFVGTAMREGMKHDCKVWAYDKYKPEDSNTGSVFEVVQKADVIFVCVPTPMFANGKCDTSIVEGVVEEISQAVSLLGKKEVVTVIKSTVPPTTTEYLNNAYNNISVIFNPEFLREVSPIEDFKNQNRIILGGDKEAMQKVANIYRSAYPNVPIVGLDSKGAELVKYITNCFLAMKVSFANEISQICEKLEISYDGVISAAMFDERLGKSHWMVPGPDGSKGYGLSCFPKDLNALTYVSKMLGVKPTMLEATWEKNLEVRPPEERDWEKMSKAVVDVKVG